MRKIAILLLAVIILIYPSVTASAISSSELQSIEGDSTYYEGSSTSSTGTGGSTSCSGSSSTGSVTLTGSDHEQEAYNFFIQQGLTNFQAAGVVGNMVEQSDVNPTQIQMPPGGNTDNPQDVPDGWLSPTDYGQLGWGIVQWTPADKVIGIAQGLGISPIYTLANQLEIVWDEMSGTSPNGTVDMLAGLEATTTVDAAADNFFENFEGGGSSYEGSTQSAAKQVLTLYGNSTGSSGTTVSSSSSQVGAEVVCLAEQQLALWQSKPGYATADFPYAANGYLDYSQNWYEEWCADFVSWLYNQAGDPLQPDPNWVVPGVPQLPNIPQQNSGFTYHPKDSGYVPQPGDIAVLNVPGVIQHTEIFISYSGGDSTYIGGDEGNYGPYGGAESGPVDGVYPYLVPTQTPPAIPSESIVSQDIFPGYWGTAEYPITGYLSPN